MAAALSLALIVLEKLPILESFKAFSMEARFNRRIEEFDRLFNDLQFSFRASARFQFAHMAWMNRLGSMSWESKRDMIADLDAVLERLEIDADQATALKGPFLSLLAFDLFNVFDSVVASRMRKHQALANEALSQYHAGKPIDPSDDEYQRLRGVAQRYRFQNVEWSSDPSNDPRLADMATLTRDRLQDMPLPDEEKEKIEAVRREVVTLANDCWEQGTITPDAQQYLDKYRGQKMERTTELFGDE